jgi:hypothetical protein
MRALIVVMLACLLAAACTADAPLTACETNFRLAGLILDTQDQVTDLDPAVLACPDAQSWYNAAKRFPAALDGVDAFVYLRNRCLYGSRLDSLPICREMMG